MSPGIAALPRVVPPEGATVAGTFIPGGVGSWLDRSAYSGMTHWIADCRQPKFSLCASFTCGVL